MRDEAGGVGKGHEARNAPESPTLRARLKGGEVVYGPFVKLSSPQTVEIAGYAGFDFAILDTEHGPLSMESVENLVRACEGASIAPLVRVYENSAALVSRALDVGAQGILVPHISDAEAARLLAGAARFAPEGERGVCRYVRAARFTHVDRYRYFENANRDTLVVAMIEGKEGIKHLDDILAVNGLDVIFVGPYDLSQSLGVPGEVTSPKVISEMARVVERARSKGLAVGTFVDDLAAARRWAGSGVQFISYAVDVGIIYEAMKSIVASLKAGQVR